MSIKKVFDSKSDEPGRIGSTLHRPLYKDGEVEKAVDVRVDELIPQRQPINRELVTLSEYNQALDQIDSLLGQLELLTNENTELRSEVGRLQGEAESLRAELNGVRNTSTGLQSSINSIQSQMQTLMSDLSAARQEANTAQNQRTLAEAEKLSAQGRADALQQQVNTLTAALNAATTPVNVNVTGGTGGGTDTGTGGGETPPSSGGGGGTPPSGAGGGTDGGTDSGGNSEPPVIIPWTPTGDVPDLNQIEQWYNDPNYLVIISYSNIAPNYGIDSTGNVGFNSHIKVPHIVLDTTSLPATEIEVTKPTLYPYGDDFMRNFYVGSFDFSGFNDLNNKVSFLYPFKKGTNYKQWNTAMAVTTWGTAMIFKRPPANYGYISNFSNGLLNLRFKLRTRVDTDELLDIFNEYDPNWKQNADLYIYDRILSENKEKPFVDSFGNDKSLVWFEKDESIYSLSEFGLNTVGVLNVNNIFYEVNEANIKTNQNRGLNSNEIIDPRRYTIISEWNEWVNGDGQYISLPNSEINLSNSTTLILKAKATPYTHIEFNYDPYNSGRRGTSSTITPSHDPMEVLIRERILNNIGELNLYQVADFTGQWVTQITPEIASLADPITGASGTAPVVFMLPGSFTNTTGGTLGQGGSGFFLEDDAVLEWSTKLNVKNLSGLGEASNNIGFRPEQVGDRFSGGSTGGGYWPMEIHIGKSPENPYFKTVTNFSNSNLDWPYGYVKVPSTTGTLLTYKSTPYEYASYVEFLDSAGNTYSLTTDFTTEVKPIAGKTHFNYSVPANTKYQFKYKDSYVNPTPIQFSVNSAQGIKWDGTSSGFDTILQQGLNNISTNTSVQLSWNIPYKTYNNFTILRFDSTNVQNSNSIMGIGNVSVVDAETGNSIPLSESTFGDSIFSVLTSAVNTYEKVIRSENIPNFASTTYQGKWSAKFNGTSQDSSYFAGNVVGWKILYTDSQTQESNIWGTGKQYWWSNDTSWDDIPKIMTLVDASNVSQNWSAVTNIANSYSIFMLIANPTNFGRAYSYKPDVFLLPVKWNTVSDGTTTSPQEFYPNVVKPTNDFNYTVSSPVSFEWKQMSNVIEYEWMVELNGLTVTNGITPITSLNSQGNVVTSNIPASTFFNVGDTGFRFRVRGKRLSGAFTEWSPFVSFNIN